MSAAKHKHRACPCGCGELADECMSGHSGPLAAFRLTESARAGMRCGPCMSGQHERHIAGPPQGTSGGKPWACECPDPSHHQEGK